jgi:hypothetical protein
MKKSWIAVVMMGLVSLSAAAQEGGSAAVTKGKMLYASAGERLGAVYRVAADGSAQLIVDGKMITVPASTISVVDGKLTTSMSKSDVNKLR